MKQATKESEFEPSVRELVLEEIEAVAGGSVPGLPTPRPEPTPTPTPCPGG